MKTTLSVKTRKTGSRETPKGGSPDALTEILEAILQNEASANPEIPVVRLKSTDSTYNPNQDRIILIRRNPFAKTSEYERTIKDVNFKSLKQFCQAGVGHLYPMGYREAAELNLIDVVHGEMRAKYKDYRNLYFKHLDAVAKFNEETVFENSPEDTAYQRALWDIKQSEIELDKVSVVENMERYQKLNAEIEQGSIITDLGNQIILQAMILAMCDAMPSASKTLLPEKLRHNLRNAVTDKQVIDLAQLNEIEKMPKTEPGITNGIRSTIQDCARKLAALLSQG